MVEKSPCACNDFLLLGKGDAGEGAAESAVPTQADFGENEQRFLPHYKVDFTEAALVVAADEM